MDRASLDVVQRPHPAAALPLAEVVAARRASGVTVSVCLPAKDEGRTIGAIVRTLQDLVTAGLVEEIVVCDDASGDDTAAEARAAGARVVTTGQVDGVRGTGKGEALWTLLACSRGDVVCWVDADITGFTTDFITRLVAPLICDPGIDFVKGYYRRPHAGAATGGGRVTELVARPLLSLLVPELTGIVQPLSGEYAGRRNVLEQVPFVQGWGVDIALLMDLTALCGTHRIAQVDLDERVHKNRPLDQLGPQAMAVMMAVLDRSGLPVDSVEHLYRFDADHEQERVPVSLSERPPLRLLDQVDPDDERLVG